VKGQDSCALESTEVQPLAVALIERSVNPSRRASSLGKSEKPRSWVADGVHTSPPWATQLPSSLDALWTRFGNLPPPNRPSEFQSEGASESSKRPKFCSQNGRVMDTADRSRRVATAAARDAAGKARALAEGLEALVRALDQLAVELPLSGSPVSGERQPPGREGELWNVAEVARYLKTSRSWVYQATASGRLPSVRVGHLPRFDPAKIWAWATSNASGSVST
jgi:excisionase family DNA binding protein